MRKPFLPTLSGVRTTSALITLRLSFLATVAVMVSSTAVSASKQQRAIIH